MKRTFLLQNPPAIVGYGTVVGPKEGQGPLSPWFDVILEDDTLGEKSFERAENKMFEKAAQLALTRARLQATDIDVMFGGDLLNQIISASFSARTLGIPFVGLYGACSTMAESLLVGSVFLSGGYGEKALCLTGSHFSTAERQYRTPLELGSQRPPTAQWTATASGCSILAAVGDGPRVTKATVGRVQDYGITDANNMGAAMAPAAADTIAAHFQDTGLSPDYYDYVVTGDLGTLGRDILHDLLGQRGLSLGTRHRDCGCDLFSADQDVGCGGSGCGCAASTFNGYYLKQMAEGKVQRILLVATGALLSTLTTQQGESVPCVAHAVAVER